MNIFLLAVGLVLQGAVTLGATTKHHRSHFNSWYPDNAEWFEWILENQCSEEHEYYLTTNPPSRKKAHAILPLIDCMLNHVGPLLQSNFAAAGVLLGLLPTVLSLAGTSTIESGLLFLERPFLAFLLSAGSVSVSPMRTFEYKGPVKMLQRRRGENPVRNQLSKTQEGLILATEYVFAAASIVNLVITSYQIGTRTVNSVSPETIFTPLIYALLSVPCHIIGAIAVFQLAKIKKFPLMGGSQPGGAASHTIAGHPERPKERRWWHLVKKEFTLTRSHSDAEPIIKTETNLFLFTSWLTSTAIILHIIYGTLILSSTLFVSAKDALGVAGRFLASTLVCRAIMTYELRGLRLTVHPRKEELELEDVQSFHAVPQQHDDPKPSVVYRQTY